MLSFLVSILFILLVQTKKNKACNIKLQAFLFQNFIQSSPKSILFSNCFILIKNLEVDFFLVAQCAKLWHWLHKHKNSDGFLLVYSSRVRQFFTWCKFHLPLNGTPHKAQHFCLCFICSLNSFHSLEARSFSLSFLVNIYFLIRISIAVVATVVIVAAIDTFLQILYFFSKFCNCLFNISASFCAVCNCSTELLNCS